MDNLELSIVVPAFDEAANLRPLVEEVQRVVMEAGIKAELIVVDDGSRDATLPVLEGLRPGRPWLRVLALSGNQGKSAAMAAGYQAARAELVGSLDADLQNDPADLVRMLPLMADPAITMAQGDRSASRRGNAIRRLSTRIGRLTRRVLLKDRVRDTGCNIRLIRTSLARRLPLQFKGIHRFIPVTAAMLGARIVELPVTDRPRHAGRSKYGSGVFGRAFEGLPDCLAVRWMLRRWRAANAREIDAAGGSG